MSGSTEEKVLHISNTLKRGLFHIFGGLSLPITALFLPRIVLLISLGAVTLIFLIFELRRFRNPEINRWFFSFFKSLLREKETSHLTGTSYMLVAALIVFLVFQRDIAVVALSFLAAGDAVATIVGMRIGKRRLFGKTLEGDLTCFVCCITIGSVFYSVGLGAPLHSILIGALGAAIVEALPLPINDNLTMPIVAGVLMTVTQF